MECGKLTAKLRDAVPVCFMEDGKEIKRFKNIEIPDEIKALPFADFKFDVPMDGAITFKIMFEAGILPTEWPQARVRKTRSAMQMPEATNEAPVEAIEEAPEETPEETTALVIIETTQPSEPTNEPIEEPADMVKAYQVTGDERKALVAVVSSFIGVPAVYQNAPTFAYAIGDYTVDKKGTLTGKANEQLEAALQAKGFIAE